MSNPLDELRQALHDLRADREEIADLKAAVERISHHHVLPRTGIDYAFSPHPPADKLKAAGISFVGRYLSGEGKALTHDEAATLCSHGLELVAIYETTGRRAAEGYNAGVEDAHRALHLLDVLRPHGKPPIYFAEADFDAAGEGLTNEVLDYITGAVHTIGWYRVGLYQGFKVVARAHAENRCKFLYQTLAWSDGKWLPEAQLRQVTDGAHLLGADVDFDKAIAADFGQFRV